MAQLSLREVQREVEQLAERQRRLEGAALQIQGNIAAELDKRFAEQVGGASIEQLEQVIASVQTRVADMHQAMPACASLETKVADVLSALVVGTDRIHQVEQKVSEWDNRIQDVCDLEANVQQLQALIGSSETRFDTLSAGLRNCHDACASGLQEIQCRIAEMHDKVEEVALKPDCAQPLQKHIEVLSDLAQRLEDNEQFVQQQLYEQTKSTSEAIDRKFQGIENVLRRRIAALEEKHEALDAVVSAQDQAVLASGLLQLQTSVGNIDARLGPLASALCEREEESRNIRGTVATLQSQAQDQAELIGGIHKSRAALKSMEVRIDSLFAALQEHEGQMSKELKQLRAVVADTQGQLADVQSSPAILAQLAESFSGLTTRVSSNERHVQEALQQRVSIDIFTELEEAVSRSELQVERRFDQVYTKMQSCATDIEAALATKASAVAFEETRDVVLKVQAQVKRAERSMQENAGLAQCQELKRAVASLQEQVQAADQVRSDMFVQHGPQKLVQLASSLQSRIEVVEQSFSEKVDCVHFRDLSAKVSSLEHNVASLTHRAERIEPLFDRVGQLADRLGEMRGSFEIMQKQVGNLREHQSSDSGCEEIFAALKADVAAALGLFQTQRVNVEKVFEETMAKHSGQIEQHLATFEREVCVMRAHMQKLELEHDRARSQTKAIERSLDAKAAIEDLQKLEGAIQKQQTAVRQAEYAVHDQPIKDEIQRCKALYTNMQNQMNGMGHMLGEKAGAEQLQSMQSAVAGMQSRIVGVEQMVREGFGNNALQASSDVSCVQVRVTKLEHCLQLKADSKDFQQLGETVSVLRARLSSSDSSQQLDSLRRQMASIQQTAEEKTALGQNGAGGALGVQTQCQLQQLVSIASSLEGKVSGVEQSLQEKAGAGQVQQLARSVSGVEVKAQSMEQTMLEKAEACQVQQIRSLLATLQSQLATVEQEARDKVGQEQYLQLKGQVGGLRAQVTNIEQELHSKAGAEQLQALRATIGAIENKIASLDHRTSTIEELCQAVGTMQQVSMRQQASALMASASMQSQDLADQPHQQRRVPRSLGPQFVP